MKRHFFPRIWFSILWVSWILFAPGCKEQNVPEPTIDCESFDCATVIFDNQSKDFQLVGGEDHQYFKLSFPDKDSFDSWLGISISTSNELPNLNLELFDENLQKIEGDTTYTTRTSSYSSFYYSHDYFFHFPTRSRDYYIKVNNSFIISEQRASILPVLYRHDLLEENNSFGSATYLECGTGGFNYFNHDLRKTYGTILPANDVDYFTFLAKKQIGNDSVLICRVTKLATPTQENFKVTLFDENKRVVSGKVKYKGEWVDIITVYNDLVEILIPFTDALIEKRFYIKVEARSSTPYAYWVAAGDYYRL